MTKESIYELQKIDCSCNDCAFLLRDTDKYYSQLEKDKENQQWLFTNKQNRMMDKAIELMRRDREKGNAALTAAAGMKHTYQGDPIPLLYGTCLKFSRPITFFANTCQLDTQKCFVHRKDLL